MDLQLTGKRALVTGSSSGLGAAIAALLAAEGAEVVVHGRDAERAAAVAADIRAAGGKADHVVGPLGSDASAVAVADAAGAVDVLVNNAGYFDLSRDWWSTTPDEWLDIYNTNVVSGVRLIRRLVPAMRERGWGRVIQIGSATAAHPIPQQPHYNATNSARENLTRSLARELRESGVTSNLVAPGGILSEATRERFTAVAAADGVTGTWEEVERAAVRLLAPNDVGRVARPVEIAGAVAYLASPVADFLTGVTLRFDGHWYHG
ncbi:SDR family NAD(P)-dependent oxidoreductase [Actinosynnema sp. NPDC050436]|uniref:SDR family NAD(P)-dependent oxidoreductase n=1 Tax=Actinosynnema sp. NPDC050436 TaxID=3155659 RepID=UPI0033EE092D